MIILSSYNCIFFILQNYFMNSLTLSDFLKVFKFLRKKAKIFVFLGWISFWPFFLCLEEAKNQTLFPNELSYFLYQPSRKNRSSGLGTEMDLFFSLVSREISTKPRSSPLSVGGRLSHTASDIHLKNWNPPSVLSLDTSFLFFYAFSSNHSVGLGVGLNKESAGLQGVFESVGVEGEVYSFLNSLFAIENYRSSQTRLGVLYRSYYLLNSLVKLHLGSSLYYYSQRDTNHLLMYAFSESALFQPSLEVYLGIHYTFYRYYALWTKMSYKSFLSFAKSGEVGGKSFEDRFPFQSSYSFIGGIETRFSPLLFRVYMKGFLIGEGEFSHKRHGDEENESLYLRAKEWCFIERHPSWEPWEPLFLFIY